MDTKRKFHKLWMRHAACDVHENYLQKSSETLPVTFKSLLFSPALNQGSLLNRSIIDIDKKSSRRLKVKPLDLSINGRKLEVPSKKNSNSDYKVDYDTCPAPPQLPQSNYYGKSIGELIVDRFNNGAMVKEFSVQIQECYPTTPLKVYNNKPCVKTMKKNLNSHRMLQQTVKLNGISRSIREQNKQKVRTETNTRVSHQANPFRKKLQPKSMDSRHKYAFGDMNDLGTFLKVQGLQMQEKLGPIQSQLQPSPSKIDVQVPHLEMQVQSISSDANQSLDHASPTNIIKMPPL